MKPGFEDLRMRLGVMLERTSEQIEAEIAARFGFIPPFFGPAAQTPQVLENLWQQTLSAYVNNPLPALFKEKLSAYLSRFCPVPYCMICHSCTLRPLGLKAQEVLQLLEATPPLEVDIDKHLQRLKAGDRSKIWSDPALEESLLYCSIFIALQSEQAEHCRHELSQFLGASDYQYLVTFIAYVKTCHAWMEAHPEVVYEADQRVKQHLNPLLEEEPALADFFNNYQEKVKQEYRSRLEQLAEITYRERQEKTLRQQVDRERLMAEISQRIRQSLNLEDILSTAVSEVRRFLQADRVFIYRFESDWSGIVAVESVAPSYKSILDTKLKDSFFTQKIGRELYKHGRIQAVADVYAANLSACHLDMLVNLQIRANLVVPIVQGEQLWGLLVANHCLEPRPWQPVELDLLKHLATQLAIAIQQSELYQQVQTELNERKRSEETIRAQAALLNITTDAIFVLNLNNQILFWNQGAEALYGWSAADVQLMGADALTVQDELPQLDEIRRVVAATGQWQGDLHQITREGQLILVESRWTRMLDEEGQLKAILVVNTDITQKKELEKQFLHAQRLESLGTLASGIAHDLNNILTPVLTAAQLLQLKLLNADESIHRLLQLQENSAKRGAALVKQVLSFARGVESKRTSLQVEPLLLEIKQIVDEIFPKSIEVHTAIEPDLWTVSANGIQLNQVLMNLCVNARDAMPNGGTITLSAHNFIVDETYAQMHLDAHVGAYVVVTVADTGIGISPDVIERIFDPFFTTKEVGKGTGLGLSTVLGILKSHGGFIGVTSELGIGSQFKLYLPAIGGERPQAAITAQLKIPQGNGEMILVVDDEPMIQEMSKTSLTLSGYQVLTAENGIEAIALYVQHKDTIQAVLMDLMMPEMDGLTAIHTLRRLNPQVKIIATSGVVTDSKLIEAADAGVKALLSKPYTLTNLLSTLSEVLRN